MRSARPASRYGLAALFGAVCGCLLALTYMPGLGSNPAPEMHGPSVATSSNDRGTRAPTSSNNYVATNANAISGRHEATLYSTPVPPDYSTLAPVVPITQTAHGYTLTLYPMYASANLIVLTYTVQLPPESQLQSSLPCGPILGEESPCGDRSRTPVPISSFSNYNPRLLDETGRTYPWLQVASPDFSHDYTSSALLVFDAQQLAQGSSGKARLRLELNVVAARKQLPMGGADSVWIAWPFNLDFSIDVDTKRRIAEPNQTLTQSGIEITINRVIATRYDLRVDWHWRFEDHFRSSDLYPFGSYTCCHMMLNAGEKALVFRGYSGSRQVEGLRTDVAGASFLNEDETWSISTWFYDYLVRSSMMGPDKLGPVFRFVMPPASD
jgi:hypothetical protein